MEPQNKPAQPRIKPTPRRVINPKDHSIPTSAAKVATLNTDVGEPTQKRKGKFPPITKKQHALLTDIYYRKGGYRGRDQLFEYLKRMYAKQETPKAERISRRQMWNYFLKRQITHQVHMIAPKNSLSIKPIVALNRFDKCQSDLIIRGGDSMRKYKAILCVVDVATRRAYTEVLTKQNSAAVTVAFNKILDRALSDLSPEDRKARAARGLSKSKTWTLCMTDNGSEFKSEFARNLADKNIKQYRGVANRSTGQAIIERFNRTLQSSVQKEITSTGNRWYNLISKHTDLYNDKPNRNLRLKNETGTYTIYTPNDLWGTDRTTLGKLFQGQQNRLSKQHKRYKKETEIKVGDTVRIALFDKRKGALQKGYTPNWSKELYTIFKLKIPKNSEVKPYLFYVKDADGKKKLDAQNNAVPYTMTDLMVIDAPPEQPPDDIQYKEKAGAYTRQARSVRATPAAPAARPPRPKKPKVSPSEHPYIGRRVRSGRLEGVTNKVNGTIVSAKKPKGKPLIFTIEWDNGDKPEQHKITAVYKGKNVLRTLLGVKN